MEEDNKRRMISSIPPNYVTLLQLQERWINEQNRKKNKEKQLEPEPEPEPKPQEHGEIGDVVDKTEVAVCLASCETADKKIETEELKIVERKRRRNLSKNGKSKARAKAATGVAEVAGCEENAPQTREAIVKSRNRRKMSTDGGREREKVGSEAKPEGAVCLVSCQITDKKEKTWKSKKNQGKGERKMAKEKRDDEEVTGGEAYAPKTSDEKFEMAKSGNAVVADRTVENPPNYVTLLQLQEQWINEQNRKKNKEKQLEPEPEPEPEPKPQEHGEIGDVVEKTEVAVCLASCETADKKIETEELKIVQRKWRRNWSKTGKSKATAQAATGVAEVAGCEENAPQMKEAIVKSRYRRKMLTDGGREREKVGLEKKPEGAVCLVSCQVTDKKEKTWKSKKNQGKAEQKKMKEKRDDEEVAGGEAYVPKTSDEKFEMAKSGNAVVADWMVEIQWRLKDMSIKGGRERRNDTPPRPDNGGHYRGGYGRFDNGRRSHHQEWKPRNAKMIWVKKGDTSGCNDD